MNKTEWNFFRQSVENLYFPNVSPLKASSIYIYIYKSKYKKVGVLPIRIVYSLTFRALAVRQRETENI